MEDIDHHDRLQTRRRKWQLAAIEDKLYIVIDMPQKPIALNHAASSVCGPRIVYAKP
ncbi:MAG TPA: hypothetical protein VKB88_23105 [Bryobacteraceae bacterium]|nr:hypothetical protein [Bryobacteraceae bacterium]